MVFQDKIKDTVVDKDVEGNGHLEVADALDLLLDTDLPIMRFISVGDVVLVDAVDAEQAGLADAEPVPGPSRRPHASDGCR